MKGESLPGLTIMSDGEKGQRMKEGKGGRVVLITEPCGENQI